MKCHVAAAGEDDQYTLYREGSKYGEVKGVRPIEERGEREGRERESERYGGLSSLTNVFSPFLRWISRSGWMSSNVRPLPPFFLFQRKEIL
jgi:hypothetical protein